jgi:hypothetical protein
MLTSFDLLWERLLQGGVARRPARRYLAELRDHLDDLIAEERQAAGDERDARSRALARLGSVDALAGAMIARREALAWSRKAPFAAYLIAPTFAFAAGAALAMSGVVMTANWLRAPGGGAVDMPPWALTMAADVVFFSNAMLAVLLGWTLGAMAVRQRSAPLWPVLGIVVLATVGAAVQLQVTLPSAAGHGEIGFSPSGGFIGRLVLNLALTLIPYAGLRLWQATRPKAHGAWNASGETS